ERTLCLSDSCAVLRRMQARKDGSAIDSVAILDRTRAARDTRYLRDAFHVSTNAERQIDALIRLDDGGKALLVFPTEGLHGLHFNRRRPLHSDVVLRTAGQHQRQQPESNVEVAFHTHSSPIVFANSAFAFQNASIASVW